MLVIMIFKYFTIYKEIHRWSHLILPDEVDIINSFIGSEAEAQLYFYIRGLGLPDLATINTGCPIKYDTRKQQNIFLGEICPMLYFLTWLQTTQVVLSY